MINIVFLYIFIVNIIIYFYLQLFYGHFKVLCGKIEIYFDICVNSLDYKLSGNN